MPKTRVIWERRLSYWLKLSAASENGQLVCVWEDEREFERHRAECGAP